MKVCNVPGCPELTDNGKCDAHRLASRRTSDRQRERTSNYGSATWRRVRRAHLRDNPLCTCGAPATDVHHRDGAGLSGLRRYDPDNLEALCHRCHSRLTARETPAGWNER